MTRIGDLIWLHQVPATTCQHPLPVHRDCQCHGAGIRDRQASKQQHTHCTMQIEIGGNLLRAHSTALSRPNADCRARLALQGSYQLLPSNAMKTHYFQLRHKSKPGISVHDLTHDLDEVHACSNLGKCSQYFKET